MAVAFDAKSVTPGSSSSTLTVSNSTLTVGAGANALIAILPLSRVVTGLTVFWDTAGANQAMTEIGHQFEGSTYSVYLFGLINPVTGNKNCTASWTNTSSSNLDLVSFSGVDTSSFAAAFPGFTGATATTAAPAVTIPITDVNSMVLGSTNNSGQCISSMDHITIDNSCSHFGWASNYSAGASSAITLGGVLPAASNWTMCGCRIAAPPTAPPLAGPDLQVGKLKIKERLFTLSMQGGLLNQALPIQPAAAQVGGSTLPFMGVG